MLSSAESLVGRSETLNGDGVSVLFSRNGRPVAIGKRECGSNVAGSGRSGWVVGSVTLASAIAVLSGKEKITAAGVEIDGVVNWRSSDGDGTNPELATFVGQWIFRD